MRQPSLDDNTRSWLKKGFQIYSSRWRWDDEESDGEGEVQIIEEGKDGFENGVALFNSTEYYKCHDVLEEVWNHSIDPQRSLIHGILQISVGMYHLLNQNHKGAMIQFGEGLNKIRRVKAKDGPFFEFENQCSTLLEFIYNTQLESAACDENECETMNGSERSYELLGNYGAGKAMYDLTFDNCVLYIELNTLYTSSNRVVRIPAPVLKATQADLLKVIH